MHVRQQIREYIQGLLLNNTAAAGRVYTSRLSPVERDGVPAIIIYTKQEENLVLTMGSPTISSRDLELSIELYVQGNVDIDNILDSLAVEVETLLGGQCVGSFFQSIGYESFEVEYEDSGDKKSLIGLMKYSVIYSVISDDPETGV